MLIVTCSPINWKFTIVVFPKFYSAVAHHIIEGEIICAKGKLSLKPEMREISLEAEQVKRATISQLREAARLEGLFGDVDSEEQNLPPHPPKSEEIQEKVSHEQAGEIKDDGLLNVQDTDIATLFPTLDTQFVCAIEGNNIIIKLSKDTSREVLLDIKNILDSFPIGKYHVWLDIGGQKIDTKKTIASL